MFQTIKSKFIINLIVSIISLVIILVVAYFLAVSSIKTIMVSDISNTAKTLKQGIEFMSKASGISYKDKEFKEMINTEITTLNIFFIVFLYLESLSLDN
ncbi:MAG: hypothetical protein U9O86_00335 [Campylobacterota bacterium]|nr:hypothetical protein [Campylobacterota bacterium]